MLAPASVGHHGPTELATKAAHVACHGDIHLFSQQELPQAVHPTCLRSPRLHPRVHVTEGVAEAEEASIQLLAQEPRVHLTRLPRDPDRWQACLKLCSLCRIGIVHGIVENVETNLRSP